MDKALVFGTKDCRFESCQGHYVHACDDAVSIADYSCELISLSLLAALVGHDLRYLHPIAWYQVRRIYIFFCRGLASHQLLSFALQYVWVRGFRTSELACIGQHCLTSVTPFHRLSAWCKQVNSPLWSSTREVHTHTNNHTHQQPDAPTTR